VRCAIYARAATRLECEAQLSELRAYAARRGWEIVAEYVDVGSFRSRLARLRTEAAREVMDRVLV